MAAKGSAAAKCDRASTIVHTHTHGDLTHGPPSYPPQQRQENKCYNEATRGISYLAILGALV